MSLASIIGGFVRVPKAGLSAAQVQAIADAKVESEVYGPDWNGDTTHAPAKNDVYDKIEAVVASIPAAGPVALFDRITDVQSTSTDGTEDALIDYFVPDNTVTSDGAQIQVLCNVQAVSSATASRRIKLYLRGGGSNILIWDSGSLTLSLGGNFVIQALIHRQAAVGARATVFVTTTSASTVPYVSFTDEATLNDIEWVGSVRLILKGAAAGAGAANGDIILHDATISYVPAGSTVQ